MNPVARSRPYRSRLTNLLLWTLMFNHHLAAALQIRTHLWKRPPSQNEEPEDPWVPKIASHEPVDLQCKCVSNPFLSRSQLAEVHRERMITQ